MQLVTAVICEEAVQREDAGYDLINAHDFVLAGEPEFPLVHPVILYTRFHATAADDGAEHVVDVMWARGDSPGTEVAVSTAQITTPGPVRELYPDTGFSVKFPVNLKIAAPGEYELVLRVDGEVAARLPLSVVLASGNHDASPG